jgi:hypothetical protein
MLSFTIAIDMRTIIVRIIDIHHIIDDLNNIEFLLYSMFSHLIKTGEIPCLIFGHFLKI